MIWYSMVEVESAPFEVARHQPVGFVLPSRVQGVHVVLLQVGR